MAQYNSNFTGQHNDQYDERLFQLQNEINEQQQMIDDQQQTIITLTDRIITLENQIEADRHTVLLLTDSPVDQSYCKHSFLNYGVISSSGAKRDNRNSIYFNGSSYLWFNSKYNFLPGIGSWTLEAWVDMTSSYSGGAIFHQNFSSRSGYGILIGYNHGSLIYIGKTSGTWDVLSQQTMANLSLNTWTHIALVKNGSTLTSYQNGTKVNSWNVGDTAAWNYNQPASIGCYYYSTDTFFYGYMQDFRISNIARYTNNFTPPTRLIS